MSMKGFQKRQGTLDGAIFGLLFLIALIMLTVYGLMFRVAKNIKFETNDIVQAAVTSALVTDIYQYATTGEIVLDCTGDGFSQGLYDTNKEKAVKQGCQVAYTRFIESLQTALHLENLNPTEKSGYLTGVKIKEFTIYNVMDDGIYLASYNGMSYQDVVYHPLHSLIVKAKETEVEVKLTSIYVSIEFSVEMFGNSYTIPLTEYVYVND